jgi:hypothetical protein
MLQQWGWCHLAKQGDIGVFYGYVVEPVQYRLRVFVDKANVYSFHAISTINLINIDVTRQRGSYQL